MNVRFHEVRVRPEPEYPAGRKGLALKGAWVQLGRKAGADGMLVLDGDVAIDPGHVRAMFAAIAGRPEIVHTAPVKLWPVSTSRPDWHWAHWEDHPSQDIDGKANYFSFCFTYLPAQLLEACINARPKGLADWTYPNVDASVSAQARRMGLGAWVVRDCYPVHVHW